jgi:sortase B
MLKKTDSALKGMNGIESVYGSLNLQFRKWRMVNMWIDRILLSILCFLIVFIGSGLIDGFMFLEEGMGSMKYHSFSQLLKINPDTVAWLTLDGTHIDHPVVRSADNFDYLDRSFEGRYYAGGTLFMDKGNRDFEDHYCMIHGHHMAAGAMFGDLSRYLEPAFFGQNRSGKLLTPDYDYDIQVFAAGVFNAYDKNIYDTGGTVPLDYIRENAANYSETDVTGHVLALSTCLDEMTDDRAVVFCALINKRPHR